MGAAPKLPVVMNVTEFLAWDAPQGNAWQLVDGQPQAMAPASRTHNAIQGELGRLIGNHLLERGSPCIMVPTPGVVPRVRADSNYRIPDLAVTCTGYQQEEYALSEPVLVVEVLSPSDQAETWGNVWAYTTIPSVREILVLNSTAIEAHLLRRDADGNWPERATLITDGELELATIEFRVPLAAIYRTTRLAR